MLPSVHLPQVHCEHPYEIDSVIGDGSLQAAPMNMSKIPYSSTQYDRAMLHDRSKMNGACSGAERLGKKIHYSVKISV